MLRLGTRGSLLARTQAGLVAAEIRERLGEDVELVTIRAEGDDTSLPLHSQPRPGAFVATLRDALLDEWVDLVVHSYKDLPSAPVPGLVVAATPERDDPRDVWCSAARLAEAPAGATVGTSSPRRSAALVRLNPGVVPVPIRGNVDTRLAKLAAGEVDGLVLAAAGLHRLGRGDAVTEYLDPETFVPAPAQGVLAIECRASSLAERLVALNHGPTALTTAAERAVLAGVEAACTTAVGAWAVLVGDGLRLVADLSDHRGVDYRRLEVAATVATADEAVQLGLDVAARLLRG